jgi:hypothetical protein
MARHYFLVGASYDNVDQTETFVKRGIWEIGYDRTEQPAQYAVLDHMKANDRIAIKRMIGGQGHNNKIKILAIGIIRDVDHERGIAFVDWANRETEFNRTVPIRGCLRTVHGPYALADSVDVKNWLNDIFRL